MGAQYLKEIKEQACLWGSRGTRRRLQAGETLFLEGDLPSSLYQVDQGCMKLTWNTPNGKEVIAELLLPGDVFDLPSCIDGSPYPLSCKAPSGQAASLWVLDRSTLLEDAQVLGQCQIRLLRQLRQQRSHPVASACQRVEVRLVRALLWLAERLGVAQGKGLSFPLWLTRQELAEWIGTTPETVIRTYSQLRRRGLIESQRGQVCLLKTPLLLELTEAA